MKITVCDRMPAIGKFILATAVVTLGCNAADAPAENRGQPPAGTSGDLQPPQFDFLARGADGKQYVGGAAQLNISFDAAAPGSAAIRLILGGRDMASGISWGVATVLSEEQVRGGTPISGRIARAPLRPGIVNLSTQSGNAPTLAEEGTLSVQLANGRITGKADVIPDALSASIEGRLVVSCLVPKGQLGQPTNGRGSGPGVTVEYGVDEAFATPFCQQYASLR